MHEGSFAQTLHSGLVMAAVSSVSLARLPKDTGRSVQLLEASRFRAFQQTFLDPLCNASMPEVAPKDYAPEGTEAVEKAS